jgi:hypothetical protein
MNAFISYSLNYQEQYIVTLLSYKLREQGFTLIMTNSETVDFTVRGQIFLSQLFVGLISSTGQQWQRVLKEYEVAKNNNIPAILLIEDKVTVSPNFSGNFVRFNRRNPQQAVEEIRRRMLINQSTNSQALGWILGGAALLAIIAVLSGENKK